MEPELLYSIVSLDRLIENGSTPTSRRSCTRLPSEECGRGHGGKGNKNLGDVDGMHFVKFREDKK
jgi:hypothetical protein